MIVLAGRRAQKLRPFVRQVTAGVLSTEGGALVFFSARGHRRVVIRPATSVVASVCSCDFFVAMTSRWFEVRLARALTIRAFGVRVSRATAQRFFCFLTVAFCPAFVRWFALHTVASYFRDLFGALLYDEVVSERRRLTSCFPLGWQRVIFAFLGGDAIRFLSGTAQLRVHLFRYGKALLSGFFCFWPVAIVYVIVGCARYYYYRYASYAKVANSNV